MLSSEHIGNEVFTLTSETPSSKNHFEKKIQARFSKSDHSFEQQQELLMEFKEKQNQ